MSAPAPEISVAAEAERLAALAARAPHRVHRYAALVAAQTGIPLAAILSHDRGREAVAARDLVVWLSRRDGLTLTQIGRQLNRHHTTVLTALRREDARRAQEEGS